ncbi:hypothetical protein Tco_1247561 [Tanacetum coccineum]
MIQPEPDGLPRNTPLDRVEVLVTMEILPESTSNSSAVDAPVTRMASAAAKPCQGDSFEFYLITGSRKAHLLEEKQIPSVGVFDEEGELNGDDLKNDEVLAGDNDKEAVPNTKFDDEPINSGSILQVMEELVKVGHTMGYNMEGCIKNIEEIIDSQGVDDENKMENIDLFSIKRCWGNFSFNYVHSSSVGDWVPNSIKLLIISVYAPQDLSEKKMLWDYLSHVMAQWEGLEEVPLGGCTFTWCHKSASKMSKLDRFLISESLRNSCPNISAITLDR